MSPRFSITGRLFDRTPRSAGRPPSKEPAAGSRPLRSGVGRSPSPPHLIPEQNRFETRQSERPSEVPGRGENDDDRDDAPHDSGREARNPRRRPESPLREGGHGQQGNQNDSQSVEPERRCKIEVKQGVKSSRRSASGAKNSRHTPDRALRKDPYGRRVEGVEVETGAREQKDAQQKTDGPEGAAQFENWAIAPTR